MISRRDWLKTSAAAGAVLAVAPRHLLALSRQEVMTRLIPGTSERIPVVGLGSSATFSSVARSEDYSALREVLSTMVRRIDREVTGVSVQEPEDIDALIKSF